MVQFLFILENFPDDPPDIDSVISFSLLFVQESLNVAESGKRNYQGYIGVVLPVSVPAYPHIPFFPIKLFCHLPFPYCNRALYLLYGLLGQNCPRQRGNNSFQVTRIAHACTGVNTK